MASKTVIRSIILADYKRAVLHLCIWFVSQLIKLNSPDLVLFVGEALVGNEAVDQLKKFNQALADYSMAENPRLIDGILLTKFDTIDDKVSYHLMKFPGILFLVHHGHFSRAILVLMCRCDSRV